MAKVLGVGGVFWKARDKDALIAWYKDVLGIDFHEFGAAMFLPDVMGGQSGAATLFGPFKETTDYLEPSTKPFMVNLVVDDLEGVLARCKARGVEPTKLFPEEENGRFAHIIDPEGLKIELWEPKPMG